LGRLERLGETRILLPLLGMRGRRGDERKSDNHSEDRADANSRRHDQLGDVVLSHPSK
jgi:hypothetical protein